MAQSSSRSSVFFEGPNICKHLQENQFHDVYAAFKKIQPYLPDGDKQLLLPTLTVVGSSIAGKSSVLENITKCPIFPRAKAKSCTRVPIRLRIENVSDPKECAMNIYHDGAPVYVASTDDALNVVTKLLGELDTSKNQGPAEILVVVKQVDVPTMEFVDMPATENDESVTERYLNEATLVLCVVDTDTESLDPSNSALQAISKAGKLHQTILVLTKADKVEPDEVEDSLFDRILKTAAECQCFDQLRGVVAVINRKHTDQISLVDAAEQESHRFDTILAGASGTYATAEAQQALRAGTKTEQLLKAMGNMYHDYMVHSWRDEMLAKIHMLLDQADMELGQLGPAPDSIKTQTILKELHDQVDYEEICKKADQAAAQHMQSLPSFSTVDPPSRWSLTGWAESLIGLEHRVKHIMAGVTDSKLYLPIVQAAYDDAFARHAHLRRFATLQQRLSSTELEASVDSIMNRCRPFINDIVKGTLRDLHGSVPGGDVIEPLKGGVRNYIIRHIVEELKMKPLQLLSDFQFVENQATMATRDSLLRMKTRLFVALEAFKHTLAGDTSATSDPEQPGPSDVALLVEYQPQPPPPYSAPMDPVLQRDDLEGSPTVASAYAAAQAIDDESDFEDGSLEACYGPPTDA